MKSAFEGGVAVVTGAGSGLGAALARRFAAEGMRVVAADLQLADAEATAEALRAEGAEAIAMPVDIGDESSIAHLAERVERELGPCQVLCANVGVQQFGRVEALTRADWEWVFGVNVFGTAATVRSFLPQLRRASGLRRILVTCSTTALYPVAHMSAYVASKAAVVALAETLRLELDAEEIGVTALFPGPMATTHTLSSTKAKPHRDGAPVMDDESVAIITESAGGEMVDPEYATRNVIRDLTENQPYLITHDVHREKIEPRLAFIRAAFLRAGDS
ncbi:MAG: SDR family oxidoreductase [Deltaproteobacteria bacterium]|jgi:NAD(P)-dependent dehydrogenase (short-subunit alcohol dehydrogenase family)|nr:SDR family oxidoreductase [Deltaproteobacteria bacterium]MBW2497221.1 SDR family oxidoreductase [Deltaproteobacteria bacterium]